MKNVDEPVRVYQVSDQEIRIEKTPGKEQKASWKKITLITISVVILFLAVIIIWKLIPSTSKIELERSIAVLPFQNASIEEGNQFFVDGMMEEIRNNLSMIADLRVVSKTSTEKYRNTDLTTREIAQELDVNYLLEGTVQKQGDQVKIHAQLILAEAEDHIWARTYTEELSDVFKVQSQMAESIAEELIATITPEERLRIEQPPTNNQEAYDLYLRARDYHMSYYSRYSDGSVTGLNSAIQLYQEAIELDPEFALAYVYLGEAIVSRTYDLYDENRGDTMLYYINKALYINPDLADAYMLRGIYYLDKRMYEKGVIDLEKSIELNPNLGGAYSTLGNYYSSQQEYILALKYYNISRKIGIGEPDHRWTLSSIGGIYMDIGDYEKARTTFLEYVNHNPLGGYKQLYWLNLVFGKKDKTRFYEDKICALDSGFCLGIISDRYKDSGNYELALFYLDKYVQVANAKGQSGYDNPLERGIIYYKLGRTEEALEVFNKHIEGLNNFINLERSKRTNSRLYGQIVAIYALLGERDKAYQYLYELEEIITAETLMWIQHGPVYEDLWKDDEFKAYIKRNEKKLEEIRIEVDRLEREGMI